MIHSFMKQGVWRLLRTVAPRTSVVFGRVDVSPGVDTTVTQDLYQAVVPAFLHMRSRSNLVQVKEVVAGGFHLFASDMADGMAVIEPLVGLVMPCQLNRVFPYSARVSIRLSNQSEHTEWAQVVLECYGVSDVFLKLNRWGP